LQLLSSGVFAVKIGSVKKKKKKKKKRKKSKKRKVDLVRQSCCAPQRAEQQSSAREDLAKSSMGYSEGKDGEAPP
jgi:hypothetical protein